MSSRERTHLRFRWQGGARRAMRPGRSSARGAFTLIELLLAISLLSAMLALLFGAFSQITGGAAAVQKQVDERQALRLLVGLIADDLASAQYLPKVAGTGSSKRPTGILADTEFVQQGEFSRIDLHAEVPARFNRTLLEGQDPGLHEVGYRVVQSEDRTRLELMRREDFYLGGDRNTDIRTGGIEGPLADRVKSFLVEFLAEDGQSVTESQELWLEEWNSMNRDKGQELPVALRVTLVLLTPEGKELGETLVLNFPRSYAPAEEEGAGDGNTGGGQTQ